MDDLIYRRDAIDVIFSDKIDGKTLEIMKELGDGIAALTLNMACDRHIQSIKELISAQPEDRCSECDAWNVYKNYRTFIQTEIIRCKECKKNPSWEWVGCPMTGKNTRKPDDFCSYAERRKDG